MVCVSACEGPDLGAQSVSTNGKLFGGHHRHFITKKLSSSYEAKFIELVNYIYPQV